MSQVVFTNARLIPVSLFVIAVFATLTSYCLAVLQDHVKPFFPFVSHAAGYPPQNAVFSGLVEICAVLGVLTSVLRYVVVQQRINLVEQKTLKRLNTISLYAGCLAFLGLLYLALNPVGFPTTDKLDYIWNVGVTHNLGAFGALFCFDIYIIIQSYLTYRQSQPKNGNAFVHRSLAVPILMSSLTIVFIFYFVVLDFLKRIPDEKTGMIALPNFQYPFVTLTTAILEWIFAFFVFFFLATFSVDFKNTKIVFRLQPKLETLLLSRESNKAAGNSLHNVAQEERDKKKKLQ